MIYGLQTLKFKKQSRKCRLMKIPYGKHSINKADLKSVKQCLKGDWLTTGPLVEAFEFSLEEFTGAPTICVSSGTGALHCAYAAIELRPGDEVITPPITFIATQAAAVSFGARIVFADVNPKTGLINPVAVEAAISSRTKAIVAVDYAGQPADLAELRKIADKYSLILIEDASHALGSKYHGKKIGSVADITTFSFFPTKNITTGEGGAVSSTKSDLLKKAKIFARQGMIKNPKDFILEPDGGWHQEVHSFGLNYRLPDILCALGISQLKRLNDFKKSRENIFENYSRNLIGNFELEIPQRLPGRDVMWHLYPILVPSEKRKYIYDYLHSKGIFVQVNYLPAYRHPIFNSQGFKEGQFPASDQFYAREISLPIYHELGVKKVNFISNVLKESFAS